MARRLRIGIDTGGTFTDVVALDEEGGGVVTTKTHSTPADPAEALTAGVGKALGLLGAEPADVAAPSRGTTVATHRLLDGRIDDLGFRTTAGLAAILG